MKYYILKDKKPVVCEASELERQFIDPEERIIAKTYLPKEDIHVSTVFLGIDHNFLKKDDPILFETMIFGFEYDNYQIRCKTYDEALKDHERALRYLLDKLKKRPES